MECEVALALVEAEDKGLHVDLPYCQEQLDILTEREVEIEQEYEAAEVNLGSVQQVAALLEDMGIKLPRTAPSKTFPHGQPQVTEEVLEDVILADPDNKFARDVLEHRRLGRNAGTYFGAYIDLAIDGKIHTFIDTLGARNGRMSSRTPNLQNVPKRRAGDYVRRAFYAPEGFKIVSADYSQIEYRIFAAAAREPDMVQAILDGKDLHAVTAQIVYDDPSIDEDDPRRDNAKNGNFAEIYMAGIPKFAHTAGITIPEATTFRKKYHQKFKQVKPFTQEVMKYAQANGLAVESKFGRRIPVDYDRVYAAVNYLISSTAADVLKRGIRRVNRTQWIEYYRLPIHDENIFVIPDELVPQAVEEIPELMADRETFSVPIDADVKVMQRWGSKGV
jgi:DNA polymerase-1